MDIIETFYEAQLRFVVKMTIWIQILKLRINVTKQH